MEAVYTSLAKVKLGVVIEMANITFLYVDNVITLATKAKIQFDLPLHANCLESAITLHDLQLEN
jgi:hypothetical protein